MENHILAIALAIIMLPLTGSLIAGLLGKAIGRTATHCTTIGLMTVAFGLACYLFSAMVINAHPTVEGVVYTWVKSGAFQFDVALLVDRLSTVMVFIVTFVSLMVHVYTIGYMSDDPAINAFSAMFLCLPSRCWF